MTRTVFISFLSLLLLSCLTCSPMASAPFPTPSEITDEDGDGEDLIAITASDNWTALESDGSSSTLLRRLLGRKNPRAAMTCDKNPKVCHMKGSPGRYCCKKRCVSLGTDSLNCGRCGERCKYGERCCRGRCVNILYGRTNCGGCHNKCEKGTYCRFGMCSYGH